MPYEKLKRIALILLIVVLVVIILWYGKSFLVPLTFAALLSALLQPISSWLEGKGINKGIAALLSTLTLVLFFAGVIALLSWQVSDLSKDVAKAQDQIKERYENARELITEKLGIPREKQDEMVKKQQSSSSGSLGGTATGIMAALGGFITDTILVLVYIFLFLYFRKHLKRFIIRIVPAKDEANALDIVNSSQKVTRKYLTGLSLMIISLWIMYGIGFTIAGVKNAILFAILCGLLEIVPFVGNLIGTTLTVLMSLVQGGGTNIIVGILITYALVQFIQTYILEPLVVGAEVNLNPLFTILALVAGEMIWGIPGMILAIPLMGVTKIVCDHIEPLKPFGELIGEVDKKPEKGFKKRMRSMAEKMRGKTKGS